MVFDVIYSSGYNGVVYIIRNYGLYRKISNLINFDEKLFWTLQKLFNFDLPKAIFDHRQNGMNSIEQHNLTVCSLLKYMWSAICFLYMIPGKYVSKKPGIWVRKTTSLDVDIYTLK